MRVGALSAEHASSASSGGAEGRVDRLARLELVRSGVTTAATLAHERSLPVGAGLCELVPSGVLQRGSTLAAHGPGATSLSLALSAEAIRSGSFLAVVAPTTFGLGACLDFGIPLRRVVQFAIPERSGRSEGGADWAQLVAAVIEGFDLVILADRHRITGSQARQLVARNRERGSVILRAGGRPWPDAPDVRYDLHDPQWRGLGQGHGHLRERTLAVRIAGRRWHGPQVQHVRLSGERGAEVVRVGRIPTASTVVGGRARFAGADIDELLDAVDPDAEGATGATHPLREVGTVA